MTLVADPIVGRDAELGVLEALLAEAQQGKHTFSVVSGEPGIGKTSVLREIAGRAEQRGYLVLEGRATELERGIPFGLLIDTFDAYLESLDARTYDRLASDGLEELASVFPSMRALGAGVKEPRTAPERFRAHHAVRELIERLAARQPLALIFDDIHWSDGASLELLGYLLRRPAQAAVFAVIALRTGQASATITATIEEGVASGQVTHVRLGPLEKSAAERLVELETADAERLYRDSGGNPFYLLQLARIGPGRLTGGDLPAAVSATIAREVDGLDMPARKLVEAAAVAGDPFDIDLAMAVAGLPETEALDALDELIARDLVRLGDAPRRFQFRHPLVRAAVYESSSPGLRLAAHERAAEALAERGAAAALRAHHVEHSARHGDLAAVGVLRDAGTEASDRAPSSAARWFEAALRIAPENLPPEERAGLLLGLAGALGATGKLDGSRSALLAALELPPEAVPMARVKLISACAATEQLLGRREDAHRRLQAALGGLSEEDLAAAAVLMFELALDAFYGQDYEGMREWGLRSVDAARASGDPAEVAASAALTAFACSLRPETIAEARTLYDEAAQIVDALTDEELAAEMNAVAWLPPTEFYLDRYSEGIRHAERGLAVARSTGQSDFFPGLIQALANLLFSTGRPQEAANLLDESMEAARLSDNVLGVAWSHLNRSYAATAAGEIEDALRAGEKAVELTTPFADSPVGAWSGAVLGMAWVEAGEPQRGHDIIVERCGGAELTRIPGAWRAIWLGNMASCWLALGRLDEAANAVALSEELAGRYGLPLAISVSQRAAAAVALERGDGATATERALASAAGAEEMGARIHAAHSRVLAGQALAASGDEDGAAAELERAAAEFEACGAPRYRDAAERELRKLGRAVYRRSERGKADGSGVESLTGRELEVARLVVDRRTNLEIASELFLSIKTVETHMRNIFRKLDASSRVEVARIVEGDRRPAH